MKPFLLFLFLLAGYSPLCAQTCQQVDLATTPQKSSLLREYIKDCREKHYFFEDKGAIKLITYLDSEGVTCWYLSAVIDDRYRALPPEKYAFFGNDVILVYQGDSNGHPLPILGDKTGRDTCVQDVLGSRVYKHSTGKQFVYSRDSNGRIQKTAVIHVFNGNLNNDLIIKFNKNGTISKFNPS